MTELEPGGLGYLPNVPPYSSCVGPSRPGRKAVEKVQHDSIAQRSDEVDRFDVE